MNKSKPTSQKATAPRRRAAERLRESPPQKGPSLTKAGPQRIIHELQVHQIELEQQIREMTAVNTALREGEDRYLFLMETAPDAQVIADLEGRLFMANSQMAALSGYADKADLIGRHLLDLVAQEDRARATADMSRAVETGRRSGVEYALVRQDGTRYFAECHLDGPGHAAHGRPGSDPADPAGSTCGPHPGVDQFP